MHELHSFIRQTLAPRSVGVDKLFDRMLSSDFSGAVQGYPPYNIIKDENDKYIVGLAVAGFSEPELEIKLENHKLIVSGSKTEKGDSNVIYRGISNKSFIREFHLADTVEVAGAKLDKGMLTISLVNRDPKARSKTIPINGKPPPEQADNKSLLTE